MTPELGGIVRTILAFIAGFVASKGWIDETLALELAGAIGVLIVGGLSWWQKHVQKKAVAVATLTEATPAAIEKAEAVLSVKEAARAMDPAAAPATVSATGKVA